MARTMAPASACQFLARPNGLRNGGDDTGMTMDNERSSMATPNDRNGKQVSARRFVRELRLLAPRRDSARAAGAVSRHAGHRWNGGMEGWTR